MALLSFTAEPKPKPRTKNQENNSPTTTKRKKKSKKDQKQKVPSSWDQFKNLLTCKSIEPSRTHDPATSKTSINIVNSSTSNYSKLGNSCSSICSFKDVVHGNTRVVHRPDDNSPESSGSVGQEIGLLQRRKGGVSHGGESSSDHRAGLSERSSTVRSNCGGALYASASSSSNSRRMPQLRKFSGCYECHMIVDPSRYPTPRTTICTCPKCGEVFPKIESLEHHQAVRHAVSELGPDDSGRNIVEIIFKSSWLKKDTPICKIERILKVHNTPRTIQRFEDCRDTVKLRATHNTKKNPRCAADGNELLRFQCTTLTCALGARGASNLCGSGPGCRVCTVIRNGFRGEPNGVRTMASSGKAHDCLGRTENGTRRAMLVCRVIAGRVRRVADDVGQEEEGLSAASYDSLAGYAGLYSDLEELIVFNPRAILPCFVVIYKALD